MTLFTNNLPIDKKFDSETFKLIRSFYANQDKMYMNEFRFKDTDDIENKELEISLFSLGYDIRMRLLLISRIALSENTLDEYLIQNAYDNYKNFIRTSKETLKSLIQKYFKLQSVYEFRR